MTDNRPSEGEGRSGRADGHVQVQVCAQLALPTFELRGESLTDTLTQIPATSQIEQHKPLLHSVENRQLLHTPQRSFSLPCS